MELLQNFHRSFNFNVKCINSFLISHGITADFRPAEKGAHVKIKSSRFHIQENLRLLTTGGNKKQCD